MCAALLLASACGRKKPSGGSVVHEPPGPDAISQIAVGDKSFERRLLRGFYEAGGGWRWTARVFAVSLDQPEVADETENTFLHMDFSLPVEVMNQLPSVTLRAKVNGVDLGGVTYPKAGRYDFYREVPRQALARRPAEVEFELDKSVKDHTGRELGLIAVGIGLETSENTIMNRERATRAARQGYRRLLEQRRLQVPIEKQNEMMKLFHELPVWRHMWFHNVQIEKNPLDLWMMQQIIYEAQPDFVVETGTFHGGSALYWAHTLNGAGLENSRVLTVDIQDLTRNAATHPLWKKYVTFFRGSSTDAAIAGEIAKRVQGRKTVIALDSDHTLRHVLKEMQLYAPLVSRGSYLVVEDTHLDGVPTNPDFGPGPMAAVRQFLADGGSRDFEQDLDREALVMTFNPGGWLRRK